MSGLIIDPFAQRLNAEPEAVLREMVGGNDKTAAASGDYIARRVYERGFMRSIIVPKACTKSELIAPSTGHDQVVHRVEMEPVVGFATLTDQNGKPESVEMRNQRLDIPLNRYMSKTYAIDEFKMLATNISLFSIYEEIVSKRLEEAEDVAWMELVKAAAVAAYDPDTFDSPAPTIRTNWKVLSGTAGRLTPSAIETLIALIEQSFLKCDLIVMTNLTFNNILTFGGNSLGLTLQEKVFVGGYQEGTILGKRLLVTTKANLLRVSAADVTTYGSTVSGLGGGTLVAGQPMILGFATDKAIGRAITWDNPKFYVERKKTLLSFDAWMYSGAAFPNNNAVAILALGT